MCVNILIPDLRATALSFLNNGLKFYIFAHGLKSFVRVVDSQYKIIYALISILTNDLKLCTNYT
jgi:hypothetical protein